MPRTFSSFRERVGGLNGHEFYRTISGGKAGYGRNKTASLQVYHGDEFVKAFRFVVDDTNGLKQAIVKAISLALTPPENEPQ